MNFFFFGKKLSAGYSKVANVIITNSNVFSEVGKTNVNRPSKQFVTQSNVI